MSQNNKWERRDHKKQARRRMKVDGAGNRVTQGIIIRRAEEIKKREALSA